MSIKPISFGIRSKLKNYEVQKRDGTTVSKDIADKVVKRNMLLFGTLVFPTIMGAVLIFYSGRKHSLKEVAIMKNIHFYPIKLNFIYFVKRIFCKSCWYIWGVGV